MIVIAYTGKHLTDLSNLYEHREVFFQLLSFQSVKETLLSSFPLLIIGILYTSGTNQRLEWNKQLHCVCAHVCVCVCVCVCVL